MILYAIIFYIAGFLVNYYSSGRSWIIGRGQSLLRRVGMGGWGSLFAYGIGNFVLFLMNVGSAKAARWIEGL
jgi:hypothetical protein